MALVHDVMIRKLQERSFLSAEDIVGLRTLSARTHAVTPDEDIVRQGDAPEHSVVVLQGMVARYHNLPNGQRQYLAFHIAGDLPDAQALFLDIMDHALCAVDKAQIALVPHKQILALFVQRPALGFAIWRETLADAAIFRQSITNNGARPPRVRMAHFFCEQYYRARATDICKQGECPLPLNQTQIGQALGLSLVTVNRTMQSLRETGTVELRAGKLRIRNWARLAALAQFDPAYLHMKREPEL
jgi:CRP-like cAMP-binding protein